MPLEHGGVLLLQGQRDGLQAYALGLHGLQGHRFLRELRRESVGLSQQRAVLGGAGRLLLGLPAVLLGRAAQLGFEVARLPGVQGDRLCGGAQSALQGAQIRSRQFRGSDLQVHLLPL